MNWGEQFAAAGKCASSEHPSGGFIVVELAPDAYKKALEELVSSGRLWKADQRYQEACRDGRLTWWDELGRAVEVVRTVPGALKVMDPALAAALGEGQHARDAAMAPIGRHFDGSALPFGPPPPAPGVSPRAPARDFGARCASCAGGRHDECPRSTGLTSNCGCGEAHPPELPPGLTEVTKPASGIVAAVKSVLPKGKKK